MNKLDINKLHRPIEGRSRGQGRTVKMIAEMLGNVDVSRNQELHVVFIPDGRRHDYLASAIMDVAVAMGMPPKAVRRGRRVITFENGASIRIVNKSQFRDLDGYGYRSFYDF